MTHDPTITLRQLSDIVTMHLNDPSLKQVWIVAETSDVAVRGGHCYLELIDKSGDGNTTLARARAVIWATRYSRLAPDFMNATGQQFSSGMKVRLLVSVDYHAVYGFKLVINDIDPSYTLGEAVRRRREILARLEKEGIIGMNRELSFPSVPQRVAVISAPGAAGYGDFINQLFHNPAHIRFNARLFPAVMQGDKTPTAVIGALESIAAEAGAWDCVVIIRGGGATSDLEAFDDYDLAANVACFPLPVVVGIGHERDVTVLDYVACKRVKTPTAAAEWLISQGQQALDRLSTLGNAILAAARDRFAGSSEQLAHIEEIIRLAPSGCIDRCSANLARMTVGLAANGHSRITSAKSTLDSIKQNIGSSLTFTVKRHNDRLDNLYDMLQILSPTATLRRGYTITRHDGRSISDPSTLPDGAELTTYYAKGSTTSILKKR